MDVLQPPPPVVECPHCVNPRSVDFPQLLATSSSASSCQGDMNPPEGAPDGFNINTHLQRIEKMKQAAQLAGLSRGAPSGNLTTMLMSVEISKAFLMSDMFAPGQPYDLKHNNAMKGSAEFGNWFYGAAANVFGYSESETLKAAAIVQQYQNFGDSNQELVDVGEMIAKMMWAAMTGQGDNPDDPAPISGGHAYNDVRKNDPDAAKKNNSCEDTEHSDNNKSSPSPSFGGAGISGDIDGGWGQGGYQYIGPGTCYACLSTHIVDLPRRMN